MRPRSTLPERRRLLSSLARASRRFGLSALAALLAVTIPAVGCRRHNPGDTHGPVAATVAGAELGPFKLGQQVSNRASLKLQLQLGGGGKPQELEVDGDWTATPTDIHDGLVEVRGALANVKVRIGAEETTGATGQAAAATARQQREEAQRELAVALAAPLFVSYRPEGTISGLWFSRGVNPSIANLQMSLVGTLQLVRGAPDQPAWVASERDVNGEYTVAYRQSAPGLFVKKKARYIQTSPLTNAAVSPLMAGSGAGEQKLSPSIRIEQSELELRGDTGGRLLEVRGEERLSISLGSPGLSIRTSVKVALTDPRVVQADALVGAFERSRVALEAHPFEQISGDPKAEVARRDRAVLAGAGFEELGDAVGRLAPDVSPSAPEAGSLQRRLEALFRLEGPTARRAPELIRALTPARGKIVVDALSLARTADSQAALAAVANDPKANRLARGNAIQYLAHQDAPSEEEVRIIAGLLDDGDPSLRQMSLLSYGAFARSLRSTSAARSAAITRDLLARLDRAGVAPDQRMELVVALGNTGGVEALPALRGLAEGKVGIPARERTEAISALRFVDDPAVDPLLIGLLGDKKDESVRMAVIDAVRFRNVGPFASALADVARMDAVAAVRNAATALLGDRLPTLPTLRPVLEQIQKSDGAPKNRELAARYLAGAEHGR